MERTTRCCALVVIVSLCGCVSEEAACADSHETCSTWAELGECDSNPYYMNAHCRAACKTCWMLNYTCNHIGEDAVVDGDISTAAQRLLRLEEYTPTALSTDPWVIQLDTFISESQADEVIRVGGHNFERSLAGDGDGLIPGRTSSTSWCNVPKCESDPVMVWLKKRITDLINCPLRNTEHLQVLKYEQGQFYKSHHDQNSPVDSPAGPRVFTFLVYLSSVAKGGQTVFPDLNLSIEPKPGRAIVWASVLDDDVYQTDPRTQHEALPVVEGVKYVANFWTHLRDFQTPRMPSTYVAC